jgi:VWFA-related protein
MVASRLSKKANLVISWIALALSFGAFLEAGGAPSPTPSPRKKHEESAGISPIRLWFAATENGQPVTNLKKEDFQVWIGKDQQSISDLSISEPTPLAIGLAIDTSGSEREGWPGSLLRLVNDFFQGVMRPGDQAFLADFNDNARLDVRPTSDLSLIDQGLKKLVLSRPYGGTALYDAIDESCNLLKSFSGARHVLVVITDGVDNASTLTFARVLETAKGSTTVLFLVSNSHGQDESAHGPLFYTNRRGLSGKAMKSLARETGGLALSAGDTPSMAKALEIISLVAHSQYSLEFQPGSKLKEDTKIKIECLRPGVKIVAGDRY